MSKTHLMVFHRAKHKLNNISISLNSVPIEQVNHTKFLGVVIDNKLDWSNHISYINSKIAKGVGIICRTKKYFSSSAIIHLYNTFILPYMIYCVEVWGNALSIHIHPLIKLQKKIRIITCLKYTPDKNVYSTTGIIPFNVLVKYRIALLMYKISSGNAPICLQQLFKSNKEVYTH